MTTTSTTADLLAKVTSLVVDSHFEAKLKQLVDEHVAFQAQGTTRPNVFVIRFADGDYNLGPSDSGANGFGVPRQFATEYPTRALAAQKLTDLLHADGTGAEIVEEPSVNRDTPFTSSPSVSG